MGEGAIYNYAERLIGLAWTDDICVAAVELYSQSDVEVVRGEYDGNDAVDGAGKGTIDPFSEQSVRHARCPV